jgi:hypothetical protein
MRENGWALIGLGLCAMVGAFLFVTVGRDIGYMPGSEYLPAMPRQVANVHAMHIQALVFHGGLISFLSGVVCAVGAEIVDSIKGAKKPATEAGSSRPIAQPKISSEAAAEPASEFAEVPTKLSTGVVVGLLLFMVAIVAIGIVLSSGRQSGTSSREANSAAENASRALNEASDAMNQAASDAQNAAAEVTREVDAAARDAEGAARRAARGR